MADVNIKTINPAEFKKIDPHNAVFLDVRTKMEHLEVCMGFGHAHVPLDELDPADFMMRHGLDKDCAIYVLCRSGVRARQACQKFYDAGYMHAYVIEGGIMGCRDCGVSLKGGGTPSANANAAPRLPLPLERQVRIAAGAFAFLGAILALLINPLYAIVPLFVGSGLVFAGITDRCGMALVLTKAPWNKIDEKQGSCFKE